MLDVERGLEAVLSPVSRDTFLNEYWETQPLVVRRNAPCYYQGLFSSQDIDHIIAYSEMDYPMLRAVQKGKAEQSLNFVRDPYSPDRPLVAQIKAAYKLYSDGYTLVVNGLEWRSPPVRRLCRYLESELSHPVGVNAYVTPNGAQGFSVHFDDHDVLILQIEGSKHWDIYPPDRPLPLEEKSGAFKPLADAQLPDPYLAIELAAGDLLYLPRGWYHAARSSQAPSLHLTMGIYVYRWMDLVQQALRALTQEDVRFRQALPPGFLNQGEPSEAECAHFADLLQALQWRASAKAAHAALARRLITRSEPTATGRLADLNTFAEITIDTPLEKPAGMRGVVMEDGEHCTFHFHGAELRLPAKTTAALKFLCEHEGPFTGRQIPGPLRESGVLVLLRRMIREGFLQRAASGAPTSYSG